MLIILEGIDGCGKSTQAKLLKEWLEDEFSFEVFLTAEPSNNEIGKFARQVLSGGKKIDPKTLALIFTSDRYEHLKNEVEPALLKGRIVICERYYHSTITYQEAQGVERNWLIELNKFARKPDITIILDVDPKTGVNRTKTNEIFENEDFLEKVRENYLKFNKGTYKIDAVKGTYEVFDNIKKIVQPIVSGDWKTHCVDKIQSHEGRGQRDCKAYRDEQV